ncbi:MAG: hypothetical protein P8J45_07960 [Phycisphaerales bacterium]|nr:hypothetical protein [Phycisphaerales bacterium]
MKKSSKIAALLALAGSTQAMAGDGFFGFSAGLQIYDDGTDLWCVIDVYADFTDDGFAVLNVFNADVSSSNGGGFHHNDLADATGGSWKPSFSFDIAGVYDPMRDSYVTIGYGVGAAAALNQTALDPIFGTGSGGYIPLNAGWFNLTPDNAQYATGGQIHIAHFVMEYSYSYPEGFLFEAEIGYNTDPGTEVMFGQHEIFLFPAPSGIALFGLAGLRSRRRRA